MGNKSYDNVRDLPTVTSQYAVKQAIEEVKLAQSGKQLGLRTRFSKFNKVLNGGFKPGNVYMFAGGSGHGKSYMMNILHEDFLNPELNGEYEKDVAILHFGFEMSAADEILRKAARDMKMSYGRLVGADGKLDDTEYDRIYKTLEDYKNQRIFYVEHTGHRLNVYETVRLFCNKFPNFHIVVSWDHTLLTETLDEKNDIDLLANIGKMSIDLKKQFGVTVILLNQMNDKIEDPMRIDRKHLHYPTKRDIHGSKQVYWACDGVCVLHRPELLNIKRYGSVEQNDGAIGYPTEGLIAAHWLKMRKGFPGLVRLKNRLNVGTIEQWQESKFEFTYD